MGPVGLMHRRASSRWLVPLLTASVVLWVSTSVRASPERQPDNGFRGGVFFHPDLERAAREWPRARGGGVYTALREVWRQWDRAEPAQVEEVLRDAARSRSLSAPARAYAELLVAYARLRRGDGHEAQRRIAALGYVDQWLVLGPFDNTGKAGFDDAQGPEAELAEPLQMGRTYLGKDGRQVRWRRVPDAFPLGWVDAGSLLRPRQPICAFFATQVSEPGLRRARPVSLWVGARGAFKLLWNGSERLADAAYRGHDFDRRAVTVWLEPGDNRVLLKVCGDDAAPMVSLRLADPSGAPEGVLRWRAEPTPHVEDGSEAALPQEEPPRKEPPQNAVGPLSWFERQVERSPDDPGLAEAFARYLLTSDGDDRAQHRARDLAYAAASSPSVSRLLLAAELSEDRNARARWIRGARALLGPQGPASSRRELREVLLAEAALIEAGPSPERALPLYEEALALDPDDLRALTGKVRLYGAAGLRHSALALVERALERSPHAVGLLNMYASGLAEVGRLQESASVESLYSALRFDDHGPLVDNLELAVRQQRPRVAEHWAKRLRLLAPDSPWASAIAARAERALGNTRAALTAYERGLSLAPDDTDTLRELSDLYGELGQNDRQLELLRRVLGLEPQNAELRQYVQALEPSVRRKDEAYAWAPERFLEKRFNPPAGFHRRTLLDLKVTEVYENGLAGQFRQIVFQPLTDAGAALSRQYSFMYQADRQRAELRGARVYRAAGGVDEAVESAEGPADNPALTMYTSARTLYVQFPRLEKGDVVELRYRVDDVGERGEFASYFGELEYLQSEGPVGHAEYVVITPKKHPLYVDAERVAGLAQTSEVRGGSRISIFRAEDVPGLSAEPAMPPWSEVLGFVHVSTYPSYRELGAWYRGLSREQLELDSATRELTRRIAAGAQGVREKVEAVFEWVVKNTRYVALEFGIYGYKPRSAVQTVARGWGDCKDKAAVIVAMLDELGIDAHMVLVRSGYRGRFRSSVASLAPFDHAIAYVPELDLYLDGTAEFAGSRELPIMDQGALALHVNEAGTKLATLPDNDPATHVRKRRVEVRPLPSGASELSLAFETQGASAPAWRRRYASDASRRARVLEDLTREFPGIELAAGPGAIVTNDLSDFEQPVSLQVRARVPRLWREEQGTSSLAVTLGERLTPEYASLGRRRLDVDIGAFASLDETFVVHVPEGQQVVRLPRAARGESEFGRYAVSVSAEPGKVVVRSQLALDVSRVSPARYQDFRRFCHAADAAFEQRLVLGEGQR